MTDAASSLLHIGTAGWSISARHAAAVPQSGTHLERYAARLNAVEINSSFYRPHQRKTYERWAASVPEPFRFAVKLPKSITHERRLIGCDDLLARFCDEVTGLGAKLGVILVQLPPSLPCDEAAFAAIVDGLTARTDAGLAVEPRHRSWFTGEVERWLVGRKVARVAADPAIVPQAAVPGGWEGLVYHRLHGTPVLYRSDYAPAVLDRIRAQLESRCAAGAAVWCIFDNTADGHALGNALALDRR